MTDLPPSSARNRDTVVVAASAGGVDALRALVSGLPPDLPAALLIVLHVPRTGGKALPAILDRAGALDVRTARDGEELRHGTVYVAAPDRHLLVVGGRARLSLGPHQNGHRPAANPLFWSAAVDAGPCTIGVVLSGTLDDGAEGCVAVERCGGVVAVQDPDEAAYPGMPRSALQAAEDARPIPLDELPGFVVDACRTRSSPEREPPGDLLRMVEPFVRDAPLMGDDPFGEFADLSCPDCGGPLYSLQQGKIPTLRCRVGHGWTPRSLLERQVSSVGGALWVALRTLEERRSLADRLATTARLQGHGRSAQHFAEEAEEARRAAVEIRGLLRQGIVNLPQEDRVEAP